MLDAMISSDLDCLRYGGNDPDIVDRIAIIGHSDLLDLPPRLHGGSSVRSYATFTAEGLPFSIRASTLANRFIRQYTPDTSRWHKRKANIVISNHTRAIIRLTWFGAIHHTVIIMKISPEQWLAVTSPHPKHVQAWRGLSRLLDAWLRSDRGLQNVSWFTTLEWLSGASGHPKATSRGQPSRTAATCDRHWAKPTLTGAR